MPGKGGKCIAVPEKLHKEIRKGAKDSNRTIKEYIEYLAAKEQKASGGK